MKRLLHNLLTKFSCDNKANIGILFTIALMPTVVATGAAVDYARAAHARSAMQAALDSTTLALAKEAPTLTSSQVVEKATTLFTSLFNRPDVSNVVVTPTYVSSGNSTLTVAATGDFKLDIMPVAGITKVSIGSSSTATWGNTRLRVALALDNTGSMASAGKLPALKTATHSLLTKLQSLAVNTGDVYVSIIPFGKDVNAGPSNFAANWVRWDLWEEVNGTCSSTSYTKKSTCTANGKVWTAKNHNTWNGCVTDRNQSYDTTATAPSTATPATLFPAEQYASCPVPVMALSNDFVALHAKVDSMIPVGLTNQTIGLQWGLQSLIGTSPLAVPALTPGYQYQQAIILLTDGLNTQNRWSSTQSTIDLRTKAGCDQAKAAGITLYTVQVNTDGDPMSTMLQQCASSPDKYFHLTSGSQIVSTFDQILTHLAQIRLSM